MAKQPAQPKTELEASPAFEPQKTEDGRTIYDITKTAPPFVAGRRVNGAVDIALFDHEASAELLAGHIWPKGMPRKERVKKADDAPAEATGGEAGSNDV
jgi:hypothetical protein